MNTNLDIVVPLHNEAENLNRLLTALEAELGKASTGRHAVGAYRVILVDDGSQDATWSHIRQAAASATVCGIRLSRNFGKEAAIRAGLELSSADRVLVMDGDLQHPPALIGAMLEAMDRSSCDLVSAVRVGRQGQGPIRALGSKLFGALFSRMAGMDLAAQTDFKLLSRPAVDRYCALGERRLFFRGLTRWLGLHETRVEFTVPDVPGSRSTWSTSALTRYAVRNITAFSTVPLQFVLWSGVLSLLFSAALIVQTLANKFWGRASEGFSTAIIATSFFGGLTLLGLGIVGIYVAALYDEVKGRPRYQIAESAGLEFPKTR
ncbi:MAG TPA: glycosyltransferase family 2 protein [Usitatibacteraceae bacterium]|nr:glycosyltransferase family 2 protein [Usitatibacteraceae bacterium]